jgi:hypothetical protein
MSAHPRGKIGELFGNTTNPGSRPTICVVDIVLKKRLGKEQRSATGLDPDSGSELGDAIYL